LGYFCKFYAAARSWFADSNSQYGLCTAGRNDLMRQTGPTRSLLPGFSPIPRLLIPRFLIPCILLIPAWLAGSSLSAQSPSTAPVTKARVETLGRRPPAVAVESPAAQLAVTRVALYKNGVGFFEHSGRVTGSQPVTIDFTTAQLNDVLQSLTAIDFGGGRIAGAGYNSTTPLDQQLKALPLALGLDPTAVDFYNAIRGARVEVRSGGVSVIGRLLNIEVVNVPEKDGQLSQKRLITVIGDAGEVRTLELTSATEVRLLDVDLHQDVTRYLQLLASTRNQGLRHLTLQDNAPAGATGSRELRVSYISEVPIWKSTYRILITTPKAAGPGLPAAPNQTVTLQGWSVVDNTTGSDWNNVQLSLIAGAPQSFIQPLSQPIYSRRPEIPIAQEAQLTPQTHESGEMKAEGDASAVALASPMAAQRALMGISTGSGSGLGSGGGGFGGPGGRAIAGAAVDALSDDTSELQSLNFQSAARASLSPNTTTAAFDDYFAYNITEPITIRKNESALVPILQTRINAERVTLWSPQHPTPLRALWITNTSDLTLDRGSFSIVEDGNFGGEGLLDPVRPAEKRLLSYAVDQAVRVTTDSASNASRVTSVTAAKGVLVLHNTAVSEITYVVKNAAPEARMVIVEHPVHQNYTLDSARGSGEADPKPVETTPTVYRYRVAVDAGATVRLHVGERHPTANSYQLTNSNDNQLTLILNQTKHDAKLEAALQPILEARRRVSDAQTALDKVNAKLTDLRSDEERQRSNVTALATADKLSRERFVHDLNATEDQIAATQKELTAARSGLQTAKDDLGSRIEALQIDESL
jgi:hypothetical protein